MAAMEQLEVHSKSYLIRWVSCQPDYTISWSIKPHKKSLNFGIFRHPGNSNQSLAQAGTTDSGPSLQPPTDEASRRPPSSRGRSYEGDCQDKLHAVGLIDVYWHGKCEAEKVTTGSYNVKGQGGMFALVFDNTFSKQISKTATVILLTYPSNNPPPASHHLHHSDSVAASTVSLQSNQQPPSKFGGPASASVEFVPVAQDGVAGDRSSMRSTTIGFYTGILKKRKRKRHQGFARRYFSLDFTSSTLSYYLNKESSALRGAIPLSLAAISANEKDREICIDSGAEVWHLRALSQADWEGWKKALDKAAEQAHQQTTHPKDADRGKLSVNVEEDYPATSQAALAHEDRGWAGVEALVGRVAGVRDAVRRLASAAAPSPLAPSEPNKDHPRVKTVEFDLSPSGQSSAENLSPPAGGERRPFWKRKTSGAPIASSSPAVTSQDTERKSISAIGTISTSALVPALPNGGKPIHPTDDISANLGALLADLNSVVSDFSTLIAENKHRRWVQHRRSFVSSPVAATSRQSFDTTASDEFFDAEDDSRVGVLNDDSDADGRNLDNRSNNMDDDKASSRRTNDDSDDDESGASDNGSFETPGATSREQFEKMETTTDSTDLSPLPLSPVQRRATVPPSTILPPSLIGFLRKNVGKDLSTIAMPVSANEPTSLVQRLAEQLEYTELLDQALTVPRETGERLLYVAAFAVSGFSNVRAKERAIRKPFNPMLGETFELVREDKGFRFLAEKVCHRPVIMACQADSPNWTFSQSPMPTQKFWGKSAELNTLGRVRIHFPSTGDSFSYTIATSFLRNIIAGEKYVEPVGAMSIHHENTGEKAVVTFKQKGMFSGRSEEVSIQALNADGDPYQLSLIGKWTSDLALYEDETHLVRKIWTVGNLVDQPQNRYGFTEFVASLNEITEIEEGHLPPTDTRLRPDQRLAENVQLDEAETVKLQLEEKQRQKRKEMEEAGISWTPRWFTKIREYADEEVWKIKSGKEGYWEQRKGGKWTDVPVIF